MMTSEDIRIRNKLALIANLENIINDIKNDKLTDAKYEYNIPKDCADRQKIKINLEFKSKIELDFND